MRKPSVFLTLPKSELCCPKTWLGAFFLTSALFGWGFTCSSAWYQTSDSGGHEKAHYSADRPIQFINMRLELTFTEEGLRSRTCEGRVEYTLRPRVPNIQTVRLEAVGMTLLGVE